MLRKTLYSQDLCFIYFTEVHSSLYSFTHSDVSDLLSIDSVIDHNRIIVTACNQTLAIGREAHIVYIVTVFSKNLCHAKRTKHVVLKLHFAFHTEDAILDIRFQSLS